MPLKELRLLERSPGRIGRDQVSHPRNGHDDHANAVCGCLRVLANWMGFDINQMLNDGGDEYGIDAWRRLRLQTYLYSGGLVKL